MGFCDVQLNSDASVGTRFEGSLSPSLPLRASANIDVVKCVHLADEIRLLLLKKEGNFRANVTIFLLRLRRLNTNFPLALLIQHLASRFFIGVVLRKDDQLG